MLLGVAGVHAVEVGGEEGGFVAAGAGADLDDDVLLVGGVLRQQRQLQLLVELRDLGGEAVFLLAAEGAQFLVGVAGEGAGVAQGLLGVAVAAVEPDDGLEVCALAAELLDTAMVRRTSGSARRLDTSS